jgi:ABC-type transporter Mla MlaB component
MSRRHPTIEKNMRAKRMSDTAELQGYVGVSDLSGPLAAIRQSSLASPNERCELNCAAVTGFSPEAILVLANAIKELRRCGGTLVLTNMPANVLQALYDLLLLELLGSELRDDMQKVAENLSDVLKRGAKSYQYYWNN